MVHVMCLEVNLVVADKCLNFRFAEQSTTVRFIELVWGLRVKWEFIVHILSVLAPAESNICSESNTPDNGAANLYAGPGPPGNEFLYFMPFYLKVLKIHSQFGSSGAAGTLWPLFCSHLYFTLNFSNLKR